MVSFRIRIIGLQLLVLSQIAHSFVLLTANIDDVKKIARKFFSEPLAEQIVDFIAKASGSFISNVSEENEENASNVQYVSDNEIDQFNKAARQLASSKRFQMLTRRTTTTPHGQHVVDYVEPESKEKPSRNRQNYQMKVVRPKYEQQNAAESSAKSFYREETTRTKKYWEKITSEVERPQPKIWEKRQGIESTTQPKAVQWDKDAQKSLRQGLRDTPQRSDFPMKSKPLYQRPPEIESYRQQKYERQQKMQEQTRDSTYKHRSTNLPERNRYDYWQNRQKAVSAEQFAPININKREENQPPNSYYPIPNNERYSTPVTIMRPVEVEDAPTGFNGRNQEKHDARDSSTYAERLNAAQMAPRLRPRASEQRFALLDNDEPNTVYKTKIDIEFPLETGREVTTEKERNKFDQYDNMKYHKPVATSGPLVLNKVDVEWWERELPAESQRKVMKESWLK